MPLNIDFQQILLHWMNLAILTGGLYVLLYKPVKQFMDKREAHYQELERQAADKLAQAEQLKAERQAQLDQAGEEIRQARAKAQQSAQQAAQEQHPPGVPAGAEGAGRSGGQEAGRPPGDRPLRSVPGPGGGRQVA